MGGVVLDLYTAKYHGICPRCGGYGGDVHEGDHALNDAGMCTLCRCPGCHDGHDFPPERISELADEDPCGSWAAYRAIEYAKEKQRQRKAEARSQQMLSFSGGAL